MEVNTIFGPADERDTDSYQFFVGQRNVGRLDRLPGESLASFGQRAAFIESMMQSAQSSMLPPVSIPEPSLIAHA